MARPQSPSVELPRSTRIGDATPVGPLRTRAASASDQATSGVGIAGISGRRLGRTLVAFGASGLAIILASAIALAAIATGPMFDPNAPAVLDDALSHAQVSVTQGAAAARSASQTLATTRDSTAATAQMLSELAATMRQGSAALRVDVLGQQPFTTMADSFARTADRADAAATEVASAGTGVDETRGSLEALATSLTALAGDLDVARSPLPDHTTVTILFALLALLLGWLALLAVGCLAIGVRLLRGRA
jgi:hypothetical protein